MTVSWANGPPKVERPITVAHVVLSLDMGGLERVVVNLIRRFDHERFRFVLCCLERGGEWVRDVSDSCETVAVMGKKPGLAYWLPFRLAGFFRAHGVDVVHCHNFGPAVYGSLAGRIARCRAILFTAHGPEMPSRSRQVVFQRLPLVDHVVTVSEHLRREALKKTGLKAERVTTVVNGVDVNEFAIARCGDGVRSELDMADDAPLLGSVGRLSPEKDYETLFKAFARVVSHHHEAKLIVVGDGPLRKDLEREAIDLGLTESVRFLGRRQDVPKILADLDAFVLASREEGLPVALLEAMAASLPVVAASVGGIPDIVVDGQTGVLVPPGDPERLSVAIRRLLIDKTSARSMGQQGMKRVTERFDVSQMICAYERLYDRLISVSP